ncbi:cytochrome b-c1 complex subunit 6, mitochondrial-like [Danaus plexippus]|uniref:cytochrome b-c1 complex subunit 6, mitochondrial-like n=1 Tax=Danaus plexippus TaxID=13037 RepID=UPI000239DFA5|nr:cytochrome b-c1 complex subunit 6, mitochondrial-like [Danaus plexippus]
MATPLFDKNSPDQLTKQRAICMERDCQSKKMYELLKACEKRVTSKTYTAETCSQEVIDLLEALDHCVGDKAFKEFK